MQEQKIRKILFILIGISTLVRAFLAGTVELGNDEVYYRTYALYPDLSHFDHPPMVGFVIQFFSLDLLFHSELFMRLGSVILGAFDLWIIFLIGRRIKDASTGLFAAMLYTSSVYGFVITGIFILPDTPQMFFWLLSIYFATGSVLQKEIDRKSGRNLVIAGVFIGLGLLSKYTSVFLWTGIVAYILLYDRRWLKSIYLYLSAIISILIFFPVIWWNIQNHFISFSFQSERVSIFSSPLRVDYFLMEILGEFLYNNPVNVIIIILSLIAVLKKQIIIPKKYVRYILLTSLPLILIFIFFSFTRRTLPHWTAPGYTTLILIAAAWLSFKYQDKKKRFIFPAEINVSVLLLIIVLILGYTQIKYGIIRFDNPEQVAPQELGKSDPSLDIYGWSQIGSKFKEIFKRDIKKGDFDQFPVLISQRWFPAANLDYYVASPLDMKLLTIGSIESIHKYYWINRQRGGFKLGMDAYFITTSHDFYDPTIGLKTYFASIDPPDTIRIKRGNKYVMNAFVYRMKDLIKLPPDPNY